jgi:hypothetical protein
MVKTLLPRVNYSRMSRSQAERTYRDRIGQTAILRYAVGSNDDIAAPAFNIEQLFALLDRLSDEDLQQYLEERQARRKQYADMDEVRKTSLAKLPDGSTGPDNGKGFTDKRGSIGSTDLPARGTIGEERKQQYARSLSDKAFAYAKRLANSGQRVTFGDVLARFKSGELK